MKKNIIIIAVALIFFILGYCLNYILGEKAVWFLEKDIQCPKLEKPLAKYFDSGIIQDISALFKGEVKEISGYNIILERDGKTLEITINENTEITRLIPPEKEGSKVKKEKVNFEELKVGDKISAAGEFDADAFLKVNSLTILPPWY